jgi:hypothetical protein
VELRIHGVSGTPPEGLLDARFVDLSAGDVTTGFYVPEPDVPVPAAAPTDRPRWLEGYSWRGMTSGSPLQALWVLLAPFALANTAAAMQPPVAEGSRLRFVTRLYAAVLRVFGLSLTLTLVMAAFIASIDEFAWQCGNNPTCISSRTTTKFLGWDALASPPRRMAIALMLPLAVIVGLWMLARRAWKARAAVLAVAGRRDLEHVGIVDAPTPLDDPTQWEDREPSEFLRHVHVAASLAVVSAMTALGLAYWANGSASALRAIAISGFVVTIIAFVAAAIGWGRRGRRLRRFVSVGALVASVAIFVALVVVLVTDPAVAQPTGIDLPGVESVIVALFLLQMIVVFLVGVLGVMPWAANRSHGVGLRGAGSAFVSGLALMLGAMLSAGVVLRVADYLGRATIAATPDKAAQSVPIVVPTALTWASRGAVVLVVLIAAALIVGGVVWSVVALVRAAPRLVASIRGFFTHTAAPDESERERAARDKLVARTRWLAGLTDKAGPILVGPAIVGFLVAGALTVVVLLIDTNHYHPAFDRHHDWVADHATTYGSWIIVGFALASVAIVLRARSDASLRRKVGILWDVTTYWPRHAQPLGPPCYTDRALPELVFRISWHVESEHRDLIVSAHSQGSVIAVPVVLQLRHSIRRHVALLTYGSPLQRLYARWFPAYFATATFAELAKRVDGRWTNLYRDTDPIGGAIPSGPSTDVEISPQDVIAPGDYVYPKIRLHSDYPAEPEFGQAVEHLDRDLRAATAITSG